MTPDLALLPLLVLPAVVAGLVYFLRAWERAPQLIAGLAAVAIAYITHAIAPGLSDDLMGRPLLLDLAAKQVFLVTLAAVALSNLALAIHPINDSYPSVSLVSASLVGIAVTLDNLTLAALFILVAGVLAVIAWNAAAGRARGHLQYLVAITTGTLVLAYSASVMDIAPEQPSRIGLIGFELGTGLLLSLIPFGLWESTLGRDSEPLTIALVSLILKPATLVLIWRFTTRYNWLIAAGALPDILKAVTLITVVYCALRAAITPSIRVYAAVASQGQFALVLLTIIPALGSSGLLPITMQWLIARVPSVIFLAAAATALPIRSTPAMRILFLFAVVALLGLPGTPLFPIHLSSLLMLSQPHDLTVPLAALSAGLAIGALRMIARQHILAPETSGTSYRQAMIATIVLAVVTLSLGLQPARLLAYLS